MARHYQEIPKWKAVSQDDWNNWKWQLANRITNLEELNEIIPLSEEEREGIGRSLGTLRMAITPYYASLMDPHDPPKASNTCFLGTAGWRLRSRGSPA